jgi:Uma2 family endonuclease
MMGSMKRESQRRYSLDDYFAVEETSHIKSEYYDGQIYAMAGASLSHNRIAANLLSLLRPALVNQNCEAFGSDLRVQTPGGLFTYPDLSVVCGEPLLIQGRPDTLTNPISLVEVLSDATREYDRGQKFTLYREIPTLREYVVVEQDAPLIERFARAASGMWESVIFEGLDSTIPFAAVDLSISLKDVYRLVSFSV